MNNKENSRGSLFKKKRNHVMLLLVYVFLFIKKKERALLLIMIDTENLHSHRQTEVKRMSSLIAFFQRSLSLLLHFLSPDSFSSLTVCYKLIHSPHISQLVWMEVKLQFCFCCFFFSSRASPGARTTKPVQHALDLFALPGSTKPTKGDPAKRSHEAGYKFCILMQLFLNYL